MSDHEKKAEIMRDLGMAKVSYSNGEPWPSDDELINPDLTEAEIVELRKKSTETYFAHKRVHDMLYPPDQHYEVLLNYLKLRRFKLNQSRGVTL